MKRESPVIRATGLGSVELTLAVPVETRLTRRFGLTHPILSAPMAFAAGGRLAAAVTYAGGLGLIGGGYGDWPWIERELREAGDAPVGCGFITWSVESFPEALDRLLARKPRAVMLSFGDPRRLGARVREAGVPLICQVQSRADAVQAIDAGADVVVAQGAEAGGHGDSRGTFTLVPELADLVAERAPETLLCAAGGVSDGRGLAAALMLGADGVLIGTRLWATNEAKVPAPFHAAALAADGDATIRTGAVDIARQLPWPSRFTARVLRNQFTDNWDGREAELQQVAGSVGQQWVDGYATGDTDRASPFVGEAIGLIGSIEPAAVVVKRIAAEAAHLRGSS